MKLQRIVDVNPEIIFALRNGVSTRPLFSKIQIFGKPILPAANEKDGFTYHRMLGTFFRYVVENDRAKANKIRKYCETGVSIFRYEPEWELKGSRKTFDIPGADRKKDALKAYYAYDNIWYPVIFASYIHEDFCKLLSAPGIGMENEILVCISPKAVQ